MRSKESSAGPKLVYRKTNSELFQRSALPGRISILSLIFGGGYRKGERKGLWKRD